MNPKNDFKAFSIGNNANVVSQERYEGEKDLKNGFPPDDTISRHVLNKALRQSSTIASVVADFIATESGSDVLDDGNIAKLTEQLNKALEQKFIKKVPDASLTQKGVVQLTDVIGNSNTLAATQKLVSDINNNANNRLEKTQNGADIPNKNEFVKNLGLDKAANLKVGNGINQIPDMSFFTANLVKNGWQKLPSGLILMWGLAQVYNHSDPQAGYLNNFPIPFPNACFSITLTHRGNDPQAAGIFSATIENQHQFRCYKNLNYHKLTTFTFFMAIGY
ncbi:phage tail protein [Photorhabdus noenieputensis]|uniref:phage tail protein n=1 Tax=Photorhabdus noenieputensis TaxID=1208607 RepID=UPI001BD3884B|nr:phage tail protein [Photorhabdus noenieputensis]MBS9435962.1 phage tail protein [Photorhabdus noenieputensis]MCK3667476.1 phage tail protein [Photorhabdus noenieputensis]